LFHKLAAGDWIDRKQNLLVIGPTGGRQVMDRLRPRSQGVPRQSLGLLLSGPTAARGTGPGPVATAAMDGCSRRSDGCSC
jgi:hypothetical protein